MDEAASPTGAGARSVLVADDHPALRSVICEALRAHGFPVEEAADGHTALELLRSGRPRAAVIDVRMPGLDGLQVCARAAREQLPCSMIVMSVVGDAETRRRVAELGAAFHQKPFELPSLLADVQRAWGDG
ncbi:MAG TPA: response regulator [Gaiellales bacterium]|nr:response regulator [Gaiellales bacterium]